VLQFDVHRNPGQRRDAMPFVVTLQNGRYDRAATRLVAPLLLATRARVAKLRALLASSAGEATGAPSRTTGIVARLNTSRT